MFKPARWEEGVWTSDSVHYRHDLQGEKIQIHSSAFFLKKIIVSQPAS